MREIILTQDVIMYGVSYKRGTIHKAISIDKYGFAICDEGGTSLGVFDNEYEFYVPDLENK